MKENWKYWLGLHPDHHPLPPRLSAVIKDREAVENMPTEALPANSFMDALGEVLWMAGMSVEPFGPPAYHNGVHFSEIVYNLLELINVADPMPKAVGQALLFAGAGHDYGHPGAAFRKDANPRFTLCCSELGADVSNEQVSAICVDEILQNMGVSVPMRLLVARLIWATTFGNPSIGPQSPLEWMIASADVAPNDSFLAWFNKGLRVTFDERPAGLVPSIFAELLEGRLKFIGYLRSILCPEAVRLGWMKNVDSYEEQVRWVMSGSHPALEMVLMSMVPQLK